MSTFKLFIKSLKLKKKEIIKANLVKHKTRNNKEINIQTYLLHPSVVSQFSLYGV